MQQYRQQQMAQQANQFDVNKMGVQNQYQQQNAATQNDYAVAMEKQRAADELAQAKLGYGNQYGIASMNNDAALQRMIWDKQHPVNMALGPGFEGYKDFSGGTQ
jgi:hypothetical protein